MSNFITLRAKTLQSGSVGLTWGATIVWKALLVDVDLLGVDPSTLDNLSDIPVAARVGTTTLTNVIKQTGTPLFNSMNLKADPALFPNQTGNTAEAMVLYREGATEALSYVCAWFDEADGLPVTPAGTDIEVSVPDDIWWKV